MIEVEKLKEFMHGRPHDKEKDIVDATIEYIEQVEKASVERHEGFSQSGMNFSQALEVMKGFGKLRLPFWNENTHVSIERTDDYTHAYFVVDSDKGSVPWIPTYPEMLSEDWEVVR